MYQIKSNWLIILQKLMLSMLVLTLSLPTLLMAEECVGKYKGKTVTSAELAQVLTQHTLWLEESEPKFDDERRVNLCEAILLKADLQKADLRKANLQGVNLKQAKLVKADLRQADLKGANLRMVQLHRASLDNADLTGADLTRANLTKIYGTEVNLNDTMLIEADLSQAKLDNAHFNHANLNDANLSEARLINAEFDYASLQYANLTNTFLQGASLVEADLTYAILTGSILSYADLKGANYFPKTGTLPDILSFTTTQNYQAMYYDPSMGMPGLVELRAAYKNVGMRDMERKLTNIIKTKEQYFNWHYNWEKAQWLHRIDSLMSWVLFDLTSAYSAAPHRPLAILIGFIFVFAVVYWLSLRLGSQQKNIVVRWESLHSKKLAERVKHYKSMEQLGRLNKTTKKNWQKVRSEIRLFKYAFYLSLLSAFRIGWHNAYGNWSIHYFVKLLQHREYSVDIQKGWLKRLSGFQSILSIYLFILWLLIYFGRPFG